VTLRDRAGGSNGEVNYRRWDLVGPSLSGLSPTREVPDDHHDPSERNAAGARSWPAA